MKGQGDKSADLASPIHTGQMDLLSPWLNKYRLSFLPSPEAHVDPGAACLAPGKLENIKHFPFLKLQCLICLD